MGFDRPLTKAALDAALTITDRAALEPGRVGAHLNRIWVTPPTHARLVVQWAKDHAQLDPGRTLFHFGAILATTPFAVPIATAAGRHFKKSGGVEPAKLRAELVNALGTTKAATTGIDNVVATFRAIGLFIGSDERLLATRPAVPKALAGWFAHVLLAARHAYEVDVESWRTAPELALLGQRPTGGIQPYPHLDLVMRDGRAFGREV